ncbi:MAG: ribosome maturation factor RimM [Deltaproteobacteria bacterium]|nr:ribosome maturation factor RimM [Deltaproteobacteria bacterium]
MSDLSGDQTPIVLAVIGRAHGIQGAVRCKVFNPETDVLVRGLTVRVTPSRELEFELAADAEYVESTVTYLQRGSEHWVIELAGVDSRDAAEALRWALLWVPRSALPAVKSDELYFADAPGYRVQLDDETPLGVVTEMISYPSVDVLCVQLSAVAEGATSGEIKELPLIPGSMVRADHTARVVVLDAAWYRAFTAEEA